MAKVDVFLGQDPRLIGVIRFSAQGTRESAVFEYDPGWLSAEDRFALDPSLPLVHGPQFRPKARDGSVFHASIADTEPDGWSRKVILRDHAKRPQQGLAAADKKPLDSLDFLLEVDDRSRVGGLRFRDEKGVFRRTTAEGQRSVPPLIELGALLSAARAFETQTETATELAFLRGHGTSLGGLRPKCTVVDDDGSLSIGKFPSVADERSVTRGEVLAMRLARAAGIDVAEARLVDSDGTPVALIRRFDRVHESDRLMYVSAATLLGVEPSDPGEHSYTEIVDALRVDGAEAQADIEELWRRIAFSILITNIDDHLRNHGFLHVDRGKWRLSPAFDLNPFPDRVHELKTWISEETGPEASIDALLGVTAYFRLSMARAKAILGEVERAVSSWRIEGRSLGMSEGDLDEFAPAFEHRERKVVKSLLT